MERRLKDEVIVISANYRKEWEQRIKGKFGKENKISVSGIVICKNEEENISRCIESMINAEFDEILIVDTGSEDETLEIALQYATQYQNISTCKYQWEDSFAQARNFGIESAKYDWVFFLDADERIIKAESKRIQDMISYYSGICDGKVAIAPVIINSKANKLYGNPRIFNRKQGYRYYGNVHEMLRRAEDIYDSVPFICLNIEIEHSGYISKTVQSKIERNMKLLEMTIKKEPMNPIWYCYKIRDGRNILYYEEKINIYQKIRELCLPKLKDVFYQYCFDWATSLVLPEVVCKKNLKLSNEILEEIRLYSACSNEDIFYFETLVKLLKIDEGLVHMEERCDKVQESSNFSSSIINTEGYHLNELKMKILEKEHKMGEYYKLKEFLFSVGYIQELE